MKVKKLSGTKCALSSDRKSCNNTNICFFHRGDNWQTQNSSFCKFDLKLWCVCFVAGLFVKRQERKKNVEKIYICFFNFPLFEKMSSV